MAIQVGSAAQRVDAIGMDGPHALVFNKVTCSTTQFPQVPDLASYTASDA